MPKGVSGVEIVAAMLRCTVAWGMPSALGVGSGLLIRSANIQRRADVLVDDSRGTFHSIDGLPGKVIVEGPIETYGRYYGRGNEHLALFMGTAGVPTGSALAGYTYLFKWAKKTDGLFATFAKKLGDVCVEEFPNVKIAGLTIAGEMDEPIEVNFDTICSGKNVNTDTGTNTLTTMASVTYAETANRIRFSDGKFYLADQSADWSAAYSGQVFPTKFKLTAKRSLKGLHTGQYSEPTGAGRQVWIDEPLNDGKPEVRLTIEFGRFTTPARITDMLNDVRKKMFIEFTSMADIAGATPGTKNKFRLSFPHLQLAHVPVADADGNIVEPVEFICHGSTVAVTGSLETGSNIGPFCIGGLNARSTDPLA